MEPTGRGAGIARRLRACGPVAVGARVGSGALWAGGLATQAEIRRSRTSRAYSSLCAAGQHVVGGGYSIASAVPPDHKVITNQEVKLGGKSGWSVNVLRPKGFGTLKLGVRAIYVKTS